MNDTRREKMATADLRNGRITMAVEAEGFFRFGAQQRSCVGADSEHTRFVEAMADGTGFPISQGMKRVPVMLKLHVVAFGARS